MNKKASSILMIIFELLAVILVIGLAFSLAKSMGESETVYKINLAQDLRLMVDTLIGVPGEAVIEYPHNLSKYIVLLDSKQIQVFQKGESGFDWAKEKISLPQGYQASGALEEKERLCLEKKAQTLFLRECKNEERGKEKI